MALAWLKLLDIGRDAIRFAIDTGTNRYFQLRVGRARAVRQGVDWIDGVYLTTPIAPNDAGGSLLQATREIAVPASRLQPGESYVQLVTFKGPDGRGPAFSDAIMLAGGLAVPGLAMPGARHVPAASLASSMSGASTAPDGFRPARKLPCVRSPDALAQATSVEDVLSSLVAVAAPIVLKLLGGDGAAKGASGAKADDKSPVAGAVSLLLKTLLSGLQPGGAAPPASAAPVAAPPPPAPNVMTKSLSSPMALGENRFVAAKRTQWSKPFIFGIDDALIGAIAGPLLNVLPQLVNAANQQRLQTQQANNKLVTDALAQVNQRMLTEQLLAAQQKAQGDQAAQLATLQQQLQALAEASDKAPAGNAKTQSLSMGATPPAAPRAAPSKNASLAFVAADPLPFNGKPRLVFARGRDAVFTLRFTVGDPVPANPLPRAILAVTLKGAHDPAKWVKVELRLTNIAANTEQSITITQADLARLPANRPVAVIAELRWPARGATHCATGATDIVLTDKFFLRERGSPAGDERELTDMSRYRPFWNKIWEAPALDALNRAGGRPKSLWELDVNTRYLVLLTPHEQANGLIETRLNAAPSDPDEIRLTTSGRLKGGIELSFEEVNKLAELFGAQPLDADRLAALRAHAVAHAESGEFIAAIKLKGRASERGMVWVVPVFRLAEFTLSAVQKIDESGQILSVTDETVRYPVPVAARVLGLRSQAGDASGENAADQLYKFDGYAIDVSQKIALTPLTDRRRQKSPPGSRDAANRPPMGRNWAHANGAYLNGATPPDGAGSQAVA